MIELTEDNFVHRTPFHIKVKIPVKMNDKDLIMQILENQEKAKKYDAKMALKRIEHNQDKKLRELIEKRIEEIEKKRDTLMSNSNNIHLFNKLTEERNKLQKLLEESKK